MSEYGTNTLAVFILKFVEGFNKFGVCHASQALAWRIYVMLLRSRNNQFLSYCASFFDLSALNMPVEHWVLCIIIVINSTLKQSAKQLSVHDDKRHEKVELKWERR